MTPRPDSPAHPGRLRATFNTREEALEAIARLHDQGVPDTDITVNDAEDCHHMLIRQQRLEIERAKHDAVNMLTPAQAKGALRWAFVGTVAGAVVVGALGLLMTLGTFSRSASIGLFAVVGALAGSVAGFVFGGGYQPEVDGELRDHSIDTVVGVAPTDADEAAAAIRAVDASAAVDAEYETHRDDPLADGASGWKRRGREHNRVDAHRAGSRGSPAGAGEHVRDGRGAGGRGADAGGDAR